MAKQTDNQVSAVRRAKHGWILTLFFSILAVFYLYPIFLVLINSLKKKGFIMKSPFALPDERSFFGMTNFVKGIESRFRGSDHILHIHVCMVYHQST